MSNEQKLEQTRNALHTAFAIIANAKNCLGNGDRDSKLAFQWHEAAQRFIQDYNANLDVYTGYHVGSGFEGVKTNKSIVSYVTRGDERMAVTVCAACSSVLSVESKENK